MKKAIIIILCFLSVFVYSQERIWGVNNTPQGVGGSPDSLAYSFTTDTLNGLSGDTIYLNANLLTDSALIIMRNSLEDDETAFEMDVDAQGNNGVNGLVLNYIMGAIPIDEGGEAILVNVDETEATGGNVAGIAVTSTGFGNGNTYGIAVSGSVNPLLQFSGTSIDITTGLVNAVDATSDFNNDATTTEVFTSDNDIVTIGNTNKYGSISFDLSVGTNSHGVAPTFEYSTGVGTWSLMTPNDGTSGFFQSGVITWEADSLTGWATGTGGDYLIRITRTRNGVPTKPVVRQVNTSNVITYIWTADGTIVNNVTVSNAMLSESLTAQGDTLYLNGNTYVKLPDGQTTRFTDLPNATPTLSDSIPFMDKSDNDSTSKIDIGTVLSLDVNQLEWTDTSTLIATQYDLTTVSGGGSGDSSWTSARADTFFSRQRDASEAYIIFYPQEPGSVDVRFEGAVFHFQNAVNEFDGTAEFNSRVDIDNGVRFPESSILTNLGDYNADSAYLTIDGNTYKIYTSQGSGGGGASYDSIHWRKTGDYIKLKDNTDTLLVNVDSVTRVLRPEDHVLSYEHQAEMEIRSGLNILHDAIYNNADLNLIHGPYKGGTGQASINFVSVDSTTGRATQYFYMGNHIDTINAGVDNVPYLVVMGGFPDGVSANDVWGFTTRDYTTHEGLDVPAGLVMQNLFTPKGWLTVSNSTDPTKEWENLNLSLISAHNSAPYKSDLLKFTEGTAGYNIFRFDSIGQFQWYNRTNGTQDPLNGSGARIELTSNASKIEVTANEFKITGSNTNSIYTKAYNASAALRIIQIDTSIVGLKNQSGLVLQNQISKDSSTTYITNINKGSTPNAGIGFRNYGQSGTDYKGGVGFYTRSSLTDKGFRMYINPYGNVMIGDTTSNGLDKLQVEGNAHATGVVYGGSGTIVDNDATPDVSGAQVFMYEGSANAVTVTDFDNPVVGSEITIIGNSDVYTVTINDGSNFQAPSGNIVLGAGDVAKFYIVADNDYICTSVIDNN